MKKKKTVRVPLLCLVAACCHIRSLLIGNNWKRMLSTGKKTSGHVDTTLNSCLYPSENWRRMLWFKFKLLLWSFAVYTACLPTCSVAGPQDGNGFSSLLPARAHLLRCVYHSWRPRLSVLRIIFKAAVPSWQLSTIHYSRHSALQGKRQEPWQNTGASGGEKNKWEEGGERESVRLI